jgi:hypothetical protein
MSSHHINAGRVTYEDNTVSHLLRTQMEMEA